MVTRRPQFGQVWFIIFCRLVDHRRPADCNRGLDDIIILAKLLCYSLRVSPGVPFCVFAGEVSVYLELSWKFHAVSWYTFLEVGFSFHNFPFIAVTNCMRRSITEPALQSGTEFLLSSQVCGVEFFEFILGNAGNIFKIFEVDLVFYG